MNHTFVCVNHTFDLVNHTFSSVKHTFFSAVCCNTVIMSESPALKKKKIRHYNPSWLNDSTFKSWLFVGNQSQGGAEASASACSSHPKMFCSVCQKAGKSNIFTQGCQDYQRSALLRHIASSSNQDGLKILKGREEFQKAKASEVLKTSDALESQLKTAYFIAQNHLPLTIFHFKPKSTYKQ